MNFAQTMRLIWIDAVLAVEGKLNRSDICNAFHVTEAVASRDLKTFIANFPRRLVYDSSMKVYRAAPLTGPAYPFKSRVAVSAAVLAVSGVMENA